MRRTLAPAIARSAVELCLSLPEEDHGAVLEAAVHLLHTRGRGSEVRLLPRLIRTEWERQNKSIQVTLRTSDGKSGSASGIATVLADALGKTIEIEEIADSSLIGGAVIQYGDDRIDMSISGHIAALSSSLSQAPLPSSSHGD